MLHASHGPAARRATANAAAIDRARGRDRRTRIAERRRRQEREDLDDDGAREEKRARTQASRVAPRHGELARGRGDEERRGPVHVGRVQLQHGRRKRGEREHDERSGATRSEAPRERQRRAEDREAGGELEKPSDAFASEEEGRGEVSVVVAPEERLRLEVGRRGDPTRGGDVARLGEVVGEAVPGNVRTERADPEGGDDQCGEREPGRFDRPGRIAARQAYPDGEAAREHGQPAGPGDRRGAQRRRERSRGERPGLAEHEHEQTDRDEPGGEGGGQLAGVRIPAEQGAEEEIAGPERRREQEYGDREGARVSGEDGRRRREHGQRRRGHRRPLPEEDREPGQKDHGRRHRHREGRRGMTGRELEEVCGREGTRARQDENRPRDDESRSEPPRASRSRAGP